MKFEIIVDDFWIEEEELSSALKSHITHEIVTKITQTIKDKTETLIAEKVKETIDLKLNAVIDATLADLIATGTLVLNKKEISIIDYVKDRFHNNSDWNTVNKYIDRISKEFGDKLKLQYNNAFANKIVQNMKTQGLLKDDVVNLLLGKD